MGSLKLMTVLMVVLGILIARIEVVLSNARFIWGILFGAAIIVLSAVKLTQSASRYKEKLAPQFHGGFQKLLGEDIRKHALSDEVVFTDALVVPELMFYAGRNIRQADDVSQVREIMMNDQMKKGIYFKTENDSLQSITHFDRSGL